MLLVLVLHQTNREQAKAVSQSVCLARGETFRVDGVGNITDLDLHKHACQIVLSGIEKAQVHPASVLLGPSPGSTPFWPTVLAPGAVVTETLVATVVSISLFSGMDMRVLICVYVYDVCTCVELRGQAWMSVLTSAVSKVGSLVLVFQASWFESF